MSMRRHNRFPDCEKSYIRKTFVAELLTPYDAEIYNIRLMLTEETKRSKRTDPFRFLSTYRYST